VAEKGVVYYLPDDAPLWKEEKVAPEQKIKVNAQLSFGF
jgi:hypothetical protein